MPNPSVRLRFAPSPTGFLHIGGVRAALFNWLYARHLGGHFMLRIEDTDLERSDVRYTDDILASLKWLGLNWDEELIYQSKRLPTYLQKAEELIASGHAYRCWCTETEVDAMRTKAMAEGKKPMYDRHCRALTKGPAGQSFVIRAKLPLEGHVVFHDMIRGDIRVENTELDDFVLIRSNGAPTYNLSCVVDDVEGRMTHIVRGDDHINNTPKQLHLYVFFGYSIPKFAHLPMILGADKKKLSKRHGAVSANAYRQEGYLPEAMLGFLARIGWSHGDQEIFTVEELIQSFTFENVQKSSGVFNTEKLLWVNGEQIRRTTPERLLGIVAEDFSSLLPGEALARAQSPLGLKIAALIQPKIKLVKELAEQMAPLCVLGAVEVPDSSSLKWHKDPTLKPKTQQAVVELTQELSKKAAAVGLRDRTGADALWGRSPSLGDAGMGHAEVDAYLREIGEKHGVKLGDLTAPMRLVVTGRPVSAAGLFDLLSLLPWEQVETRLRKVALL